MDTITTPSYALGHSNSELRRLTLQSAFWGELTEEIFRRAGIGPGMRVLDIGSGAGDVALLTARLVGPSGDVLGIDRSEDAVMRATARAAADGIGWCRFAVADAEAFQTDQRFDAVVGRLVLMYFKDPAGTLRSLVRYLRPGGIAAFHEIILNSMLVGLPPDSLMSRVAQWVIAAFEHAKAEVDMGLRLDATFRAAGLVRPETHAAARLVSGADSPGYAILAALTCSLLPVIEKYGIATAAEVDVDTLTERLRQATVSANACWLSPVLVGAWARAGT